MEGGGGQRSVTVLLVMMMAVIIANTSPCNAASTGTTSVLRHYTNSSTRTDGPMDYHVDDEDVLIAYQDVELEFLMDSEISRRNMQGSNNHPTNNAATDPNNPAFCGRGRYRSCTGPRGGIVPETCGVPPYKRSGCIN